MPYAPSIQTQAQHGGTHLGGKLDKKVVICGEGANAGTLADGGGQRFNLIKAAVKLIQRSQPVTWGEPFISFEICIHIFWYCTVKEL